MNVVHTILIRESHLDTFGHMNNAMYLTLFEEARWESITKNGYGLKDILKIQKGPVILDAQIKFLKEIRLREQISMTLELLEYKSKVGKLFQQMLKSDGTIAAELTMSFGLFDLQARRLIDPTPEWKRALGIQDSV
jgi:YbgC/YbaW family acyl-CoA thioester hydrolase